MIKILEVFISSICMVFAIYYVSGKLLYQKSSLKDTRTLMILLLHMLIVTLLYLYAPNSLLRVFSNVMIICIIDCLIFKESLIKTFVASFITFSIISFSEIIWTIFLMIGLRIDTETLKSFYFVNILINTGIAVITFLLVQVRTVIKIFHNLLDRIIFNKKLNIIVWLLVCILSLSILFYYIYFKNNVLINLILTFFLIICCTCLPLTVFKEKSENIKLWTQYELMTKDLLEYEQMLSSAYMKNHENDNNLISIRGMIDENNCEAIDFINSLLHVEPDKDNNLILKTRNIPIGGLQGLIHQKLVFMISKGIQYNLTISREIDRNSMKNLSVNTIKNICTITGVLLDNAIDEVQKYKMKLVGIYLYKDNSSIVLSISNNYEGFLDIENFDKSSYTTKTSGHGYGLTLVKKILEEDPILSNERVFNKNIFSQIIRIRLD